MFGDSILGVSSLNPFRVCVQVVESLNSLRVCVPKLEVSELFEVSVLRFESEYWESVCKV